MNPFETLVESMAAIVQNDAGALRAVLAGARPARIAALATRHNCSGILLHGIMAAGPRDEALRAMLALLKPYGQKAALQNPIVRDQLRELVATLNAAGVDHALLKTGARLYAGEPAGAWTAMCDLDVMIRREQADAALAALRAIGYRTEFEERAEYYQAYHHHLAPLVRQGIGKPVELHLALARPEAFSLQTDWNALRPHLARVDGLAGTTLRLDPLGTALHLALHGIGLYRVYDAVMLAFDLRAQPSLVPPLRELLAEERIQPVGASAVLALAARIAGLPVRSETKSAAFVRWVTRREALPIYLRNRAQFVDAFFGNGGRVRGTCTRFALPAAAPRESAGERLYATGRTVARALTGLLAVGYPSRLLR